MVFSKGLPVFFFFCFRGAKSFEESALEAEEHWNECIKEVLWKGGFGAPSENLGFGDFFLLEVPPGFFFIFLCFQ